MASAHGRSVPDPEPGNLWFERTVAYYPAWAAVPWLKPSAELRALTRKNSRQVELAARTKAILREAKRALARAPRRKIERNGPSRRFR